MSLLTLAYSTHRPETLDPGARLMREHDTVVLEEPRSEDFFSMLEGKTSIADYLLSQDFEYPVFAERSCRIHRQLHLSGIKVLQVDPFMDVLVGIHEMFASGGRPTDIEPGTITDTVYQTEKAWTGKLLRFYELSAHNDFTAVVNAVKNFAKSDAAKGRLRDAMRAEAICHLVHEGGRVYVEAGHIHFALLAELAQRLPSHCRLLPVYLMEPVARKLLGRRQVLGPGDVLTLLYTFMPGYREPKADLLAARSLIHNKLLSMNEIPDRSDNAPHTVDEARTTRAVSLLSFDDCRSLYPVMRKLRTSAAWEFLFKAFPEMKPGLLEEKWRYVP